MNREHAFHRENSWWHTADGKKLVWSEIKDGHLLYIVRHLVRRARRISPDMPSIVVDGQAIRFDQASRARRQLSIAVDEVEWRGLLPTHDELRVAWDRACGAREGSTAIDPDNVDRNDPTTGPWCLIDLWVGYPDKLPESAVYEEPLVATWSASATTAHEIATAINDASTRATASVDGDTIRVTFLDGTDGVISIVSERQPQRAPVRRPQTAYTSQATAGRALHRRLSR